MLGRLNACANSVYQALLRFSHAPGTRLELCVKTSQNTKILTDSRGVLSFIGRKYSQCTHSDSPHNLIHSFSTCIIHHTTMVIVTASMCHTQ